MISIQSVSGNLRQILYTLTLNGQNNKVPLSYCLNVSGELREKGNLINYTAWNGYEIIFYT